jgi:dual specificity MAP kinase phosphatase
MPCPKIEINNNTMGEVCTPQWLGDQLESGSEILVLDCRAPTDYQSLHVQGAIHVAIPTLMLRRLKKGNLSVSSVISCNEGKEKFNSRWKAEPLVVYDDCTTQFTANSTSVISLLMKKLREDGCCVSLLQGGFASFHQLFPQHCVGLPDSDVEEGGSTILGLRNLRIEEQRSVEEEEEVPTPNSSSAPFPVKVLPYLFLGNEKNSSDIDCLSRNGIKYILNVTPNVPNKFEGQGTFKYMQIPISDHWSENLVQYFPRAIAFIEEARSQKCGVLVHCLAGISRSVTVTVAYLMHTMALSLNDAYDVVKRCKPNISPNFNFMGQLLDFEATLQNSPCKQCDSCSSAGESPSGSSSQESSPGSGSDVPQCRCRGTAKTYFSSPTSAAPHLPGMQVPLTPS